MKRHNELRKHTLKHITARVVAGLVIIVVGCTAFAVFFGDSILNSYVRTKVEKAFALAHPGDLLRIGPMDYSWQRGRLVAESVLLTTAHCTFRTGQVAIRHLRWAPLLWRNPAPSEIFARSSLEATNLALEFSSPRYELRCAQLEASVSAATLSAVAISLQPQMGDDEFFAAHPFRATRFRVVLPACRVAGLSYAELLDGAACRAQLLQLSGPDVEALVNCERPTDPGAPPGLMVNEALAALGKMIALDALLLTNGQVKYCERIAAAGPPGIVIFGAIQLSAKGLVSKGPPGTAMSIQAQGNLMNTGRFNLAMSLPVVSPDFSLSYAGSLGAMDVTAFNAFLEIDQRIRITSCQAQSVAFDIQVTAGRATGSVQPVYRDLHIAFLDHQTGSATGLVNRIESLLANDFSIRDSSVPDASGSVRIGKVKYERKPGDTFTQFVWFALRSGVLDSIRH